MDGSIFLFFANGDGGFWQVILLLKSKEKKEILDFFMISLYNVRENKIAKISHLLALNIK